MTLLPLMLATAIADPGMAALERTRPPLLASLIAADRAFAEADHCAANGDIDRLDALEDRQSDQVRRFDAIWGKAETDAAIVGPYGSSTTCPREQRERAFSQTERRFDEVERQLRAAATERSAGL